MTKPAPLPAHPSRPALLPLALGVLAVIVIVEIAGGVMLRPGPDASHEARVLAIPGVAGLIRAGRVDPSEITQVAAAQHRPGPRALPALALIDVLVLVGAAAAELPYLSEARNLEAVARPGSFIANLALLLGSVLGAVSAISRMRYLVALYLSPPYGTLSYVLLYGLSARAGPLVALSVVLVLKLVAFAAIYRALPRQAAGQRAIAGLTLSSVTITVVAALCYSLSPPTQVAITDALAAAIAALAASVWAGLLVSVSVRQLA